MKFEQAISFEKYVIENSAVRHGGLFLSALIESEPRMRKTDNPYWGHVLKVQRVSGAAGFDYESLVNGRLAREGKDASFEASKPNGRHHVTNMITESDKEPGKFYINLFLIAATKSVFATYIDTRDGTVIPYEKIEPFLYSRGDGAEQGGLEKKIDMLCPKIENVRDLKCGDFQL